METYREKVSWPLWCHLLFLLGAAACFYGAARLFARDESGLVGLLPLATGLCLVLVWWRMHHIVLECGPEGAAFGFVRPRRRVPREAIQEAAVEEYSMARYMGWGYRLGWKPRDRAYSVIGCGRGIRLRFVDQDKSWSIFISSKDPEAALEALKG